LEGGIYLAYTRDQDTSMKTENRQVSKDGRQRETGSERRGEGPSMRLCIGGAWVDGRALLWEEGFLGQPRT
jgi:hypothetical protein